MMPSHVSLGPGGEFERIRAFWRRLGERAAPSGDDCALVSLDGAALALGTDLSVEGTHFRIGWLGPHEIGWRAAAAALSDLAAVAASPAGVLASLGISGDWPEGMVAEVMDGLGECAASVGATVWGGDLVRSERLVLDVVVVGRAPDPVRRAGAHVGQGLWVTGVLGGPAAAVAAWERRVEPERSARERFARPVPRVAEAGWLGERGAAAMIDVSDGLLADAAHLAAASGVRCVVEAERVPVHPGADSPEQALSGGEEYELLVALPESFGADAARQFRERFGLSLARVGRVEEGEGVELLREGRPSPLPEAFEHF